MRKVHNILGFKMYLGWCERHHGYYGLILIALSSWLMIATDVWQGVLMGAILFGLGMWCLIDDIYQHHRQVKERSPLYYSPLHNAFRFLY